MLGVSVLGRARGVSGGARVQEGVCKGLCEGEESVHPRHQRACVRLLASVQETEATGVSAREYVSVGRVRAQEMCAPRGAGEKGHVWREKGENTAESERWL